MRRCVYLIYTIAAMLGIASADVIVPGNTSGGFGNPSDQINPLIPAISVTGPAVIQITASGCLTDAVGPACITPNGFSFTGNSGELTLSKRPAFSTHQQIRERTGSWARSSRQQSPINRCSRQSMRRNRLAIPVRALIQL